jgi:hypothetical protein
MSSTTTALYQPKMLVWLDDELFSSRATYVKTWSDWFDQRAPSLGVTVHKTNSLEGFRHAVDNIRKANGKVDLLVLDMMLTNIETEDFTTLGFPEILLHAMDGGAQIAGFLLNNRHATVRSQQNWIQPLLESKIALLSSNTAAGEAVRNLIDHRRLKDIEWIAKLQANGSRANTWHEDFDKQMTAWIQNRG